MVNWTPYSSLTELARVSMMQNFLEKPQCRARILFADFLCTFNKMQPHILCDCSASYFELPNQFLVLLLNFLTNRIQRVLVNGHMSSIRFSSTCSPQRCVLLLVAGFTVYTDSCISSQEGSFVIVKFSDDTALLTLLQGRDSDHGQALPTFVKCCDDNFVDLYVSKTRQNKDTPEASTIPNKEVEIVESYKYLGTILTA